MVKKVKVSVSNLKELEQLAETIYRATGAGTVFALIGELGSGKTAFTKLFLKKAGINKKVTSPTFVLMMPYKKGRLTYYHLDLYRTKSFKEVEALGTTQLWLKKQNVLLIEWADKIKKHLPANTIQLKFKIAKSKAKTAAADSRTIQILNAPKKLVNMLK